MRSIATSGATLVTIIASLLLRLFPFTRRRTTSFATVTSIAVVAAAVMLRRALLPPVLLRDDPFAFLGVDRRRRRRQVAIFLGLLDDGRKVFVGQLPEALQLLVSRFDGRPDVTAILVGLVFGVFGFLHAAVLRRLRLFSLLLSAVRVELVLEGPVVILVGKELLLATGVLLLGLRRRLDLDAGFDFALVLGRVGVAVGGVRVGVRHLHLNFVVVDVLLLLRHFAGLGRRHRDLDRQPTARFETTLFLEKNNQPATWF